MVSIKSEREIELMKTAGHIVYKTHQHLKQYLKPGVTTSELEQLANEYIVGLDATPSFKNFHGYPAAICTSVNEEVVHGIPSGYKLKDGDIISIDIGACYKGYHGDSAWSYGIGNISEEHQYLLKHTEAALSEGLNQVKPGKYIGDIGYAIERYAVDHNLGVVRELVGHGVGNRLHEAPDIPNYGKPHTGIMLKEGMTLAIEPMLNLGTREVAMLDDDWTIVTRDGKPSAHFEHTVLVTKDGYLILTGE